MSQGTGTIGLVTLLELVTDLSPAGDQPAAIDALVNGVERGDRFQTLLGITGSGKSATIVDETNDRQEERSGDRQPRHVLVLS